MIEFRVRGAAAGAVYAGMFFGIIQLVLHSKQIGLPELAMAMLAGGAMALPLTACHVAAAFAVLLVAPRQPFAAQFALFSSLSFSAWLLTVALIDQAFRAIGEAGHKGSLAWLAFFVAGTGACLIAMVAASRRTRTA